MLYLDGKRHFSQTVGHWKTRDSCLPKPFQCLINKGCVCACHAQFTQPSHGGLIPVTGSDGFQTKVVCVFVCIAIHSFHTLTVNDWFHSCGGFQPDGDRSMSHLIGWWWSKCVGSCRDLIYPFLYIRFLLLCTELFFYTVCKALFCFQREDSVFKFVFTRAINSFLFILTFQLLCFAFSLFDTNDDWLNIMLQCRILFYESSLTTSASGIKIKDKCQSIYLILL